MEPTQMVKGLDRGVDAAHRQVGEEDGVTMTRNHVWAIWAAAVVASVLLAMLGKGWLAEVQGTTQRMQSCVSADRQWIHGECVR